MVYLDILYYIIFILFIYIYTFADLQCHTTTGSSPRIANTLCSHIAKLCGEKTTSCALPQKKRTCARGPVI